jgi:hypothetical protein
MTISTTPTANIASGHVITQVHGYRGSGVDRQVCITATNTDTHVIRWVYLRDITVLVWP